MRRVDQQNTEREPTSPSGERGFPSTENGPAGRSETARSRGKTARGNGHADDALTSSFAVIPGGETSRKGERSPAGSSRQQLSQATRLIRIVEEATEPGDLFHTATGVTYVTLPTPGPDGQPAHHETYPLRGKALRTWLGRKFYEQTRGSPGSQAMQDAIEVLAGMAEYDGPERAVYIRHASHNGAVYLDLGDPVWSVVEVTATGWSIVPEAPVRFWRPRGYGALPAPQPGGALADLRQYLNVDDDGWPLVEGWLVGTMAPTGPYLILGLLGSQGSAKSTTARVLRELSDPNAVPLRRPPRDERSLAIAATSQRLVAFDNLSTVPEWLSDVLCTLATGGGFAARELYTDADERLFEFAQQPVMLTSIEDVIVRGDLLDRSLLAYLPPVAGHRRRAEAELQREFRAAQPKLLGALLDAASTALRRAPGIQLDRLPRMADAAVFITAAGPALGLPEGATFLGLHEDNQAEANEIAVNASLVGRAVRHLAELAELGKLPALDGRWQGTARELLALLNEHTPAEARSVKEWPPDPTRLAGKLRSIQPALAGVGIEVTFERGTNRSRERRIAIERLTHGDPSTQDESGKSASAASAASDDGANTGAEQGEQLRTLDAAADAAQRPTRLLASDDGMHSDLREWDWSDAADAADADLQPQSGEVQDAPSGMRERPEQGAPDGSPMGPDGRPAWDFQDAPVGPCVVCGHECHTRAPDGRPVHPIGCWSKLAVADAAGIQGELEPAPETALSAPETPAQPPPSQGAPAVPQRPPAAPQQPAAARTAPPAATPGPAGRHAPPRLAALDAAGLWTPEGLARPGWQPADALALLEAGRELGAAQVWVHPAASRALGLEIPASPFEPAPSPFVAAAGERWKVWPEGLAPWLVAKPRGAGDREEVALAFAAADPLRAFTALPDGPALLRAVELFAERVGLPFRFSTGSTARALLESAGRGLRAGPAAPPPVAWPRGEGRLVWSRPLTAAEQADRFVQVFDQNAQYLGTAVSLELGTGAPEHRGGPVAFDRKLPGYWLAELPELLDAMLPSPFALASNLEPDEQGRRWATTPTLELAVELGFEVAPADAYVWPEHGRHLRPWAERLRNARAACLADPSPPSAAVLAAVKEFWGGSFLGRLESQEQGFGGELARPDWTAQVIAKSRCNLFRKLERLRRPPFAVDVDAVFFTAASPDPAEVAAGLGLPFEAADPRAPIGWFKHQGVAPLAALDGLDLGRGPAAISAALEGAWL